MQMTTNINKNTSFVAIGKKLKQNRTFVRCVK